MADKSLITISPMDAWHLDVFFNYVDIVSGNGLVV